MAETGGNPLLVTHATRFGSQRVVTALARSPASNCSTATPEPFSIWPRRSARSSTPTCWPPGTERRCCLSSSRLEQAEASGLVVAAPDPARALRVRPRLVPLGRYRRLPVRRRLELHASAAAALIPACRG